METALYRSSTGPSTWLSGEEFADVPDVILSSIIKPHAADATAWKNQCHCIFLNESRVRHQSSSPMPYSSYFWRKCHTLAEFQAHLPRKFHWKRSNTTVFAFPRLPHRLIPQASTGLLLGTGIWRCVRPSVNQQTVHRRPGISTKLHGDLRPELWWRIR